MEVDLDMLKKMSTEYAEAKKLAIKGTCRFVTTKMILFVLLLGMIEENKHNIEFITLTPVFHRISMFDVIESSTQFKLHLFYCLDVCISIL